MELVNSMPLASKGETTSTKWCLRCDQVKPLTAFRPRRQVFGMGTESWCRPCANAYEMERRNARETYEQRRDINLRYNHGISLDEYDSMHAEQGGVCAICGLPETRVFKGRVGKLHVDHNHVTGRLRALLCRACNNGLGSFGDDVERLKAAIAYIERHAALSMVEVETIKAG
jgi:hypothetical protein